MAHGGARNRSGPRPDPKSSRSEQKGVVLTALPRKGFRGKAPAFPLPGLSDREAEVWSEAWRTPQAAAWAEEPWRWRTVALWVRWSVLVEDTDTSAATLAQVHRLADQIGMTPAGLKENGWRVADEDTEAESPRRKGRAAGPSSTPAVSPRNRLKVVGGNDGD